MAETNAVVTDSGGVPMPYSSKLSNYLRRRNPRRNLKGFVIGEWLRSLSVEELTRFVASAGRGPKPESIGQSMSAHDDVMLTALIASAVEHDSRTVPVNIELVHRIQYFAILEQFSRDGMIVINKLLSLRSGQNQMITLTEKGKAAGIEIRRGCH